MIEINTIADFQALSVQHQSEILRSIRTNDRLDQFLISLNTPKKVEPHWVPCKGCEEGKCKRCNPQYPGWHWLEPHERDNSDIHPSQIEKCLKYLVLCCSGYAEYHEERIDPRLRRIFDMGHAWHNIIQGYGKKGAWCDPQDYLAEEPIDPDKTAFDGTPVLPVAAEFWIKGSVDALIRKYVFQTPSLGLVSIRLIHEYKTINHNGYENLKRPKPEHKKQATIYSAVFDVPIVVYIYTDKDNCQMADFPVPFDQTIWQDIAQKVRTVQYYVNNNLGVPWEQTSATTSPGDCQQCPLKKVCQPPLARRVA